MIDPDVVLGKDVKIFDPKLVNIFGCGIGDQTFVGPFVEITRGVNIGRRCIIESHSFLCTGTTLEDEVFIGHGVMFTNDLYPRTHRHVEYLPILVKKGAGIGSNATIIGGSVIGKYAVIGAGSVVKGNVEDYSIYAGVPAKRLKIFTSYKEMFDYMESKQLTDSTNIIDFAPEEGT
jgi:UDP-2-acetamido-3-amino-2,3-dideoxy-glucuronate N-acetyltransferase